MKSKEEILHKNNLRDFKELGEKVNNSITTYSVTFACMEDYAKEYTRDFIERISRNPITCYSVNIKGQNKQFFLGQDYIKRLLDSLK